MAVLRTWGCLNCDKEFESWEAAPECPDCGCLRVSWVPRGGHIAGVSRTGDAEFKALADVFKFDDLRSVRRGEAAKITQAPPQAGGTPHDFGGFVANIDPTTPAYNGSQCLPVANKVNFKTTAAVGRPFGGGQLGAPAVREATAIDYSHKAKP